MSPPLFRKRPVSDAKTATSPSAVPADVDQLFEKFKAALASIDSSISGVAGMRLQVGYWRNALLRRRVEEYKKQKTETEKQDYVKKVKACTELVTAYAVLSHLKVNKIVLPHSQDIAFFDRYDLGMQGKIPAVEEVSNSMNNSLRLMLQGADSIVFAYLNNSKLKFENSKHSGLTFEQISQILGDLSKAIVLDDKGQLVLNDKNIKHFIHLTSTLEATTKSWVQKDLKTREFLAKVLLVTAAVLFVTGFVGIFTFPPLAFAMIPSLAILMCVVPEMFRDPRFHLTSALASLKDGLKKIEGILKKEAKHEHSDSQSEHKHSQSKDDSHRKSISKEKILPNLDFKPNIISRRHSR